MPKTFQRRILRPGHYRIPQADGTTRREYVGKERIKNWIDKFNEMRTLGMRIPAPWRHDPNAVPLRHNADTSDVDAFNNGGWWQKLWQNDAGELWGDLEVFSDAAIEKVGTTVQDVSLLAKPKWSDSQSNKDWDDALTHIALVTHPVARDGDNFKPVETGTIALSLEQLAMADDMETATPLNAGSITVKDVLAQLRQLESPILLPDDTTAENFLERLVTAINAIRGTNSANKQADTVTEPGAGAKEQPGPVAMSKETTLKMSAEDQALVNWGKEQARNGYKARIEKLVKTGRVAPAYAKQHLAPLVSNLELAFSAEGAAIPNVLDTLLVPLEALPANSVLTGSAAAARKQRSTIFPGQDVAFSLDLGTEQDLPEPDSEEELTDVDGEAIATQLFASAGWRPSDYDK